MRRWVNLPNKSPHSTVRLGDLSLVKGLSRVSDTVFPEKMELRELRRNNIDVKVEKSVEITSAIFGEGERKEKDRNWFGN